MFIETYYDERSTFCATSDEPAIPYPELVGEELKLWKRYLPTMRELENVASGSMTMCLTLSWSS